MRSQSGVSGYPIGKMRTTPAKPVDQKGFIFLWRTIHLQLGSFKWPLSLTMLITTMMRMLGKVRDDALMTIRH